jgi:hypothetical protein
MDGSCDPEHGWGFWLLMAPLIMILWLMVSGLVMVWWRLIVNPRITDGKIR